MKVAYWPNQETVFPTLGGDPEIGLLKVSDGSLENPKFVLGTDPIPVKDSGDIGIDGFMAELHPAPSTCRESLTKRYRRGLQALASYAEDHSAYMEALLTYELPVISILGDDSGPAHLTNREIVGCHDYDIYTGKTVWRDRFKALGNRSGGGHIHIGIDFEPPELGDQKLEDVIIRMLDKIVGVPCVLLDYGGAEIRRQHYGNAGSFRLPSHGLEYRVLSNFWIRHPALQSLVYLLVKVALYITLYEPELRAKICEELPDADVIRIINNADQDAALEVMEYLRDIFGKYDGYIYPFLKTYWDFDYDGLFCEDICDNWSIYRKERWPKRWWGDSFSRNHNEPVIDGHIGLATFCDRMPSDIHKVFESYIRKGYK